ncbi:TrkA C-terminal domain-containing protein [Clostridium paridis]|uniref:GntR family transcriptional regulator n=1 Tax=Clostridium paridis TaxID=2803863 RepID=A0A937FI47_9CLOT|nr:TrkA C-terminal domain-containing protein [Clostridium paridis]MBL4932497.1 GntR family transcriptional regulator [Clostridium paridis]
MSEVSIIKPVYQQISIDLANRIASGEFAVGTKIHGRSTLAGKYNVSPETIRRAVILLEDMDIVEVMQGSGIMVKSKEAAFKFIEKFKSTDSITSVKKEIQRILNEKKKLDEELFINANKLFDFSERFKNSNPFAPIEIEIPQNSKLINKTIGEVNFWQNTGATIIGIRRGKSLILSPGPYATFVEGDIYIMIGEESSYERVTIFLNE